MAPTATASWRGSAGSWAAWRGSGISAPGTPGLPGRTLRFRGNGPRPPAFPFEAPHFVNLVLAREKPAGPGSQRIRTTLDLPLQRRAQAIVNSHRARLAESRRLPGRRGDRRQPLPGGPGPGGFLRLWPPGAGLQQRRRGLALPGLGPQALSLRPGPGPGVHARLGDGRRGTALPHPPGRVYPVQL